MSGNGSATRNGPGDWADENTQRARELLGRIRRMAIKLTSRPLWQVLGHILLDDTIETRDVEVFSGVGFFARPKDNGRAEALVFFPNGGAGHPVVFATRDEDSRKKVAKDLAPNETQMHNDTCLVRCKANGTIELRLAAGVAEKMIKGETYRAAEDTLFNAIKALCTALATSAPALGTVPQQTAAATAAGTAATAIETFQAAAATYLATVGKVQ